MRALEGDVEVKKKKKRINNLNSKEINWTDSIVSTNKSWKQFMQIEKLNETNTVSSVSISQNH